MGSAFRVRKRPVSAAGPPTSPLSVQTSASENGFRPRFRLTA